MVAIVHKPQSNSGSVSQLASYLDKDKDSISGFFTNEREHVDASEVILSIDNNRSKLTNDDDKFYMLTLNPSHDELCSVIGRSVNDRSELSAEELGQINDYLKRLTHDAMDAYALNFQRASVRSGNDLLYFARIEQSRIYKPTHANISREKPIGSEKGGLNYHVHVIVSRKSKDGKVKLSPNVVSRGNEWELAGKNVVRRGFNHEAWKREVQLAWDKLTGVYIEADSYIAKEDSISKCSNHDLKELVEYRFSRSSYVVHEMMVRGYNVKKQGESYVFKDRRTGESFEIVAKDLRAREQRVSVEERYKAWLSQSKDDTGYSMRSYSFMAKDPETGQKKEVSQRYFKSEESKVLSGYNECYYASLTYRTKEEILQGLEEGKFKEVLSSVNLCQTDAVIRKLEEAGFEHTFNHGHIFTRTSGEEELSYRMSHRELSKFASVSGDTLSSIGRRFDLALFRRCSQKENYALNGINIEKQVYKDKKGVEKSLYVVRDQKTDSLAYLKDVLREANQRERERRKMRASGGTPDAVSHVARKAKSLVMRNALEGDVAHVVGSVQQVANLGSVAKSFATDPGTAIARKLLDKVKSIVLVPFKQI